MTPVVLFLQQLGIFFSVSITKQTSQLLFKTALYFFGKHTDLTKGNIQGSLFIFSGIPVGCIDVYSFSAPTLLVRGDWKGI